jgi:hypothetical protein
VEAIVGARRRACASGALVAIITLLGAPSAHAGDDTTREMRSLDEQVQEAKSEVLSIATELDRLEERLLFPSSTQVAVFIAVAAQETFRLDSVQIQIDGEPVARHVYSFKELEALQKGGVQRIYTGNVATGAHRIEVSIAGKSASGKDFSGSQSFEFSKDAPPKLLEITFADGGTSIQLGDS